MWQFTCDRCGVSIADANNDAFHNAVNAHHCPTDMWKDIVEFHEKFGFGIPGAPTLLPEELRIFRTCFLKEELDEFVVACNHGNIHDAADALIDLVYVALGTLRLMGVPGNLCWDEVQRANMSKVRATHPSQSKRGSMFDVVKPEGWVPPDHSKHIKTGGE